MAWQLATNEGGRVLESGSRKHSPRLLWLHAH